MSISRRSFVALAGAAVLTACGRRRTYPPYTGPEVTTVVVSKEQRRLYLMHHNEVLKSYRIDLGFTPDGTKTTEGDGRTPEGWYVINRRNPNSEYFLSVGISYPNVRDVAQARARGVSPGGDIFIHGTPRKFRRKDDWTAGCIAVKDKEMIDIYRMVRLGTPIYIGATLEASQ